MDEPTTALDVVVQREILAEIVELQDRLGFAVLFITHDLSLLLEIADRIVIMYAGQVVESGTREQIHRRAAHPYTRGLLDSFPRLHGPRVKLAGIPGSPPDLRGALRRLPVRAPLRLRHRRVQRDRHGARPRSSPTTSPRARSSTSAPGAERSARRGTREQRQARRTGAGGARGRRPRRSATGSARHTSQSTPSAASRSACGAARSSRWSARAARARRRWRAARRAGAPSGGQILLDGAADRARPRGAASAPTRERCRWSSRTRSPRSTRCTRCATTSSGRVRLHSERTGREAGTPSSTGCSSRSA